MFGKSPHGIKCFDCQTGILRTTARFLDDIGVLVLDFPTSNLVNYIYLATAGWTQDLSR